jgi:elongation factor 1-gamma
MSLKLVAWHHPSSARAMKLKIAAAFAGIKMEDLPMDVCRGPEREVFILNCHPLGAAPVLQTDQGYLFESNAILRHIARLDKTARLYGATDFEASGVDQWLDFTLAEVDPFTIPFMMMNAGFQQKDEATIKEATQGVNGAFEGLDKWLDIRTFLVGERPTIADIAVFVCVETFLRYAPTANEAYKFKNVIRHYMTMLHHPRVQEALKASGHEASIPAKPKEEKAAAPKKEEKPKEAAAPKPAADEEDEGPTFEDKKKPNPLDALPPSNFVLDAFKREYSNNDTRTVAAPYLFDNFDPAGYTAFWCNYKYNDENKMQFMTANLIRGWFQRMDHVRKYGFGIAIIAGEDKKHEVTCFWIFRGKGLPEIVREVDDTELFTWTEIADVKAERAKITDYLAWDGETFKDKPVLEGRAFK